MAHVKSIDIYFDSPNRKQNTLKVEVSLKQSFPDHFTPKYSNQRSLHMQVGNAVPPLLSYAIASSIKKMLGV